MMKKTAFLQAAVYIEQTACLVFTLLMALNAALNAADGREDMRLSSILVILAVSLGAAALSFVAFSERMIKRAPAAARYAIMCAGLAAMGLPLGWFGGWRQALATVAITAVISLLTWLAAAARARLYDAKLREYQARREREE